MHLWQVKAAEAEVRTNVETDGRQLAVVVDKLNEIAEALGKIHAQLNKLERRLTRLEKATDRLQHVSDHVERALGELSNRVSAMEAALKTEKDQGTDSNAEEAPEEEPESSTPSASPPPMRAPPGADHLPRRDQDGNRTRPPEPGEHARGAVKSWVVPVLAAAAVALVSGMVAWRTRAIARPAGERPQTPSTTNERSALVAPRETKFVHLPGRGRIPARYRDVADKFL
ncbi:TPA: hypothetical protein EYP13_00275 [Candidatus Micrarchaeota archaeon]|nr:hypothetical protein [Candidatus Micrarchaeota archaeon]